MRRIGWASLALLFVMTGLGVGVYAFWQGTHQNQSNANQTNQNTSCTFSASVQSAALPAPATYKPTNTNGALVTTDLTKGSGPAAKSGDCLIVKYYGTLTNGTVFDQDYTKSTALQFPVGQGMVIPGWDSGLIGMKVGGVRRLVIPPGLAYGKNGQGAIPPNATLVFVVKLLNIK